MRRKRGWEGWDGFKNSLIRAPLVYLVDSLMPCLFRFQTTTRIHPWFMIGTVMRSSHMVLYYLWLFEETLVPCNLLLEMSTSQIHMILLFLKSLNWTVSVWWKIVMVSFPSKSCSGKNMREKIDVLNDLEISLEDRSYSILHKINTKELFVHVSSS